MKIFLKIILFLLLLIPSISTAQKVKIFISQEGNKIEFKGLEKLKEIINEVTKGILLRTLMLKTLNQEKAVNGLTLQ